MSRSERKESVGPLSPKEAAAIERVHPETIRRALIRGDLKGYRIGSLWRVTPEALAEYRKRRATG